ncbi:MAG: hypothetical protein ACFFCS_08660 [Candidatus Hodarchaeota archaeon]
MEKSANLSKNGKIFAITLVLFITINVSLVSGSTGITPSQIGLLNYQVSISSTYNWIDATAGTHLSLSDDGSYGDLLPFTFQFYDDDFSWIYISANGYLSFTDPTPSSTGGDIPSTSSSYQYMIAPFWTDLQTAYGGGGGDMYVWSNSTHWVVSWIDIEQYTPDVIAGSFQLVLDEYDGITFNYDYINYLVGDEDVGLNYGLNSEYYTKYEGLTTSTNNLALSFEVETQTVRRPWWLENWELVTALIVIISVAVVIIIVLSVYFTNRNKKKKSKEKIRRPASRLQPQRQQVTYPDPSTFPSEQLQPPQTRYIHKTKDGTSPYTHAASAVPPIAAKKVEPAPSLDAARIQKKRDVLTRVLKPVEEDQESVHKLPKKIKTGAPVEESVHKLPKKIKAGTPAEESAHKLPKKLKQEAPAEESVHKLPKKTTPEGDLKAATQPAGQGPITHSEGLKAADEDKKEILPDQPAVTEVEEDISKEVAVEVEKPECVFCHEDLAGLNYSCPSCKKKYCFKCAAKHSFCIKCGTKMKFKDLID